MLEAAPNSIKTGSHRRRKYFARAMNSLLTFLIFYGATCGLVHSHTVYLSKVSTQETVFNDAQEDDLTDRLLPSGKDCLLCQFHQQLSHGLFQTAPFTLRPPASIAYRLAANLDTCSASHESTRGRGPPSASLL
jgi:hypothetical protein